MHSTMYCACPFKGGHDSSVSVDCGQMRRLCFAVLPGQDREFPEIESLVEQTRNAEDVDLLVYRGLSLAQGLAACIEAQGRSPLAFVLGTRQVWGPSKPEGAGAGQGRGGA
jgi:hypothetical protein